MWQQIIVSNTDQWVREEWCSQQQASKIVEYCQRQHQVLHRATSSARPRILLAGNFVCLIMIFDIFSYSAHAYADALNERHKWVHECNANRILHVDNNALERDNTEAKSWISSSLMNTAGAVPVPERLLNRCGLQLLSGRRITDVHEVRFAHNVSHHVVPMKLSLSVILTNCAYVVRLGKL